MCIESDRLQNGAEKDESRGCFLLLETNQYYCFKPKQTCQALGKPGCAHEEHSSTFEYDAVKTGMCTTKYSPVYEYVAALAMPTNCADAVGN